MSAAAVLALGTQVLTAPELSGVGATSLDDGPPRTGVPSARIATSLPAAPLHFEPRAPHDGTGHFEATGLGYRLRITPSVAHLLLPTGEGSGRELTLTVEGADKTARLTGEQRREGVVHRPPSTAGALWLAAVPPAARVSRALR